VLGVRQKFQTYPDLPSCVDGCSTRLMVDEYVNVQPSGRLIDTGWQISHDKPARPGPAAEGPNQRGSYLR